MSFEARLAALDAETGHREGASYLAALLRQEGFQHVMAIDVAPLLPPRQVPPRPTAMVPALVDGQNGWRSPSGVLPRGQTEPVLLIDPQGQSRQIERGRIAM